MMKVWVSAEFYLSKPALRQNFHNALLRDEFFQSHEKKCIVSDDATAGNIIT